MPCVLIGPSPAIVGAILFTIANFGYQAALIYYDATLSSRSPSCGRVSGIGVATGTLGTILIAVLILLTASGPLTFLVGGRSSPCSLRRSSLSSGSRDRPTTRFKVVDALGSWAQLGQTIRDAGEVACADSSWPALLHGPGLNTVIVVMSVFATQAIGLSSGGANIVLLILTIVAVIASFGWLSS